MLILLRWSFARDVLLFFYNLLRGRRNTRTSFDIIVFEEFFVSTYTMQLMGLDVDSFSCFNDIFSCKFCLFVCVQQNIACIYNISKYVFINLFQNLCIYAQIYYIYAQIYNITAQIYISNLGSMPGYIYPISYLYIHANI